MPLLSSRRLPKAFQRSVSPLSRKVARSSIKKRKKNRISYKGGIIGRRFRRRIKSITAGMSYIRAWIFVLIGCILLVAVLFFFMSPTFAISSIRVSRQDRRVDVEEIQKHLSSQFGRHIMLVSPVLIARDLKIKYPEVSSVSVKRLYPNELHIMISMDDIAAEVVLGEPDETETDIAEISNFNNAPADGLYRYVTEQGVYLEYAFELEDKRKDRLNVHIVDWATKPEHRQTLIKPEVLQAMRSAAALLTQSFGSSVTFITLYIRAKEFHVHTFHPGRPEGKERLSLWFDITDTVLTQINRYRIFLKASQSDVAEDYVDLRLHDRVVYR